MKGIPPLQSLVLILLTTSFLGVHGELFTALVELTRSLDAEVGLADDILSYATVEEARIAHLRELAHQMMDHARTARSEQPERYLSNPVNAFLLVKKFTLDWRNKLENLLSQRTASEQDLMSKLTARESDLPTREDLKGAADALIRLQDTYKLPTAVIAKGKIHPNSPSPELTAEDCFFLGQHTYGTGDVYHTKLWMQEALDRLDQEAVSSAGPSVNRSRVLDHLSYSLHKQGNTHQALAFTNEWLTLEPGHERALSNKRYYEYKINEELTGKGSRLGDEGQTDTDEAAQNSRPSGFRRIEEFNTYEALCRDEITKVNHFAHELTCRYFTPHPHFYIGPVKEELVYKKPRIVIWYDIIHDDEIAIMKALATPRLQRATVQNAITGKLEYAPYRISKSAWLPYSYDDMTEVINDRISAITGIDISTAEDLQVVNYGIGGQYEPHFDFARRREKNAFEKQVGNRIATLLFYMSDVDAGGATVFTRIGAKLWPKKNAAAFWWNLYPSGDGDLMTRHAACPVLAGSKWVMNKWFHERGQEFTRPCKLTKNAS